MSEARKLWRRSKAGGGGEAWWRGVIAWQGWPSPRGGHCGGGQGGGEEARRGVGGHGLGWRRLAGAGGQAAWALLSTPPPKPVFHLKN